MDANIRVSTYESIIDKIKEKWKQPSNQSKQNQSPIQNPIELKTKAIKTDKLQTIEAKINRKKARDNNDLL
jgi:hypothetical protein